MDNKHKNIILGLLGCAFVYLFVWVSAIAAAMPVPELLKPLNSFMIHHYANIVTVVMTIMVSLIILMAARAALSCISKQNALFFSLPIILFSGYLIVFMSFAAVPLAYSAISTLFVMHLFTAKTSKTS